MVEQTVGVLVGGRGSYVRDWKIVRLYAFDKFKLGAVRHNFVVAIRDHEQAQTGPLLHGIHMVDRIVKSGLTDNRAPVCRGTLNVQKSRRMRLRRSQCRFATARARQRCAHLRTGLRDGTA